MSRLTEKEFTACSSCGSWDWCKGGCSLYEIYEKLKHYEDLEEAGRLIEVRYGEWQPVLFDSKCSACGYSETTPLMIMRRDFKYCPNCGAKMLKELEGDKE